MRFKIRMSRKEMEYLKLENESDEFLPADNEMIRWMKVTNKYISRPKIHKAWGSIYRGSIHKPKLKEDLVETKYGKGKFKTKGS